MLLPERAELIAGRSASGEPIEALKRINRGLGRCGCGARATRLQGPPYVERCATCARRHRPITDAERFANLRQAQSAGIGDADRIRQLRWARLTSLRRGV